MSKKRRNRAIRRPRDVHGYDTPQTYQITDMTKAMWMIGSGFLREEDGEATERVAAALVLGALQQHPEGFEERDLPTLASLTADMLIEHLYEMVSEGLLTEEGLTQ